MRKISIVTLVTIFFALTIVVINIALVLEYKRQVSDLQLFAFQRFVMSVKMMRDMPEDLDEQLAKLGICVSKQDMKLLRREGEILFEDPFSDIILYEKKLYFVPRSPPQKALQETPPLPLHSHFRGPPPVLEDKGEFSANRVWILSAVVNVLLILFFIIVLRKLLGLRNLKSAIRAFGNERVFKPIVIDSADELGEIAMEFNQAMEKIHLLKEARTLFLRNILHELKTPIMKGQIISQSLENPNKKEPLERVFRRLESLLGEMVKVEKLTSNEWVVDKKEYRLVDVVDHARDLLMSDTSRIKVNAKSEAPIICVDFELFSTALKNLLDNALKYSIGEVEVGIDENCISVCSFGEKLQEERLDFSRAFNRDREGAPNGLGLGLYIANAVITKHGFALKYLHVKGQNCFMIAFD